ncbi:DUF397 domain-containing protein [Streptomyces sp. NPDC050704]|uniref:DUF397 domain-containing protein n=1 Tax=Streptomyces sp. NPDC050704 TaxID=3157219 RepID=UPI003426CBA8
MATRSEAHWYKSSYSGGSGTECVECAHTVGSTLVRDSKHTNGPVVAVPVHAWQAFIWALEGGKLEGREP